MTIKKLTFSSSHSTGLNFGPSCKSHFSLWNDSSRAKIRVKWDEISIKFKNPYYMFDYFQIKKSWFWAVFTQKTIPTEQQLGWSIYIRLKYNVLTTSHKKSLMISAMDLDKWIFQEKCCRIFWTTLPLFQMRYLGDRNSK